MFQILRFFEFCTVLKWNKSWIKKKTYRNFKNFVRFFFIRCFLLIFFIFQIFQEKMQKNFVFIWSTSSPAPKQLFTLHSKSVPKRSIPVTKLFLLVTRNSSPIKRKKFFTYKKKKNFQLLKEKKFFWIVNNLFLNCFPTFYRLNNNYQTLRFHEKKDSRNFQRS